MRKLRITLAVAAVTTLVGGGAYGVAQAAATGCRVTYTVGSQWNGGFTGNVSVTNLGDPLNGWTLRWTYGAGQVITQAWNATVTQSGGAVTAVNASYNGPLATNGSVSFGFNA